MLEAHESLDMKKEIYVDSQILPEVEFWKEGEEYYLDVKVVLKSITKTDGKKTKAVLVIKEISEKPPKEVAVMRHAEFKKALAEEKRRLAQEAGEIYE